VTSLGVRTRFSPTSGTRPRDRGFHALVEKKYGAHHDFNPPGCPNANADVESFHGLVQREFFEREQFRSCADFLAKITTYQHYFNLARPISTKRYRTPLEVLTDKDSNLSENLLLLNPLFLATLLSTDRSTTGLRDPPHLDHDLPVLPARRQVSLVYCGSP